MTILITRTSFSLLSTNSMLITQPGGFFPRRNVRYHNTLRGQLLTTFRTEESMSEYEMNSMLIKHIMEVFVGE